jgi:two-component system chemotaxis response regulator CheB
LEKIKVLIVDDSAIVREVLSEKLSMEDDIIVVGTAPDPYVARDKILKFKPDIITLDIEMPRMDGLTFLGILMKYFPIPVIIVSSVTTQDKYAAIKALELGAFDIVNKPGGSFTIADVIGDILYKIRQAYLQCDNYIAKRKAVDEQIIRKQVPFSPKTAILTGITTTDRYIAIGASTGGTIALEYIIKNLPANLPPVLIVQHMPPLFTKQFANRLDDLSELNVKEAEEDEIINPGYVYIAPGGYHLTLIRKGITLYTRLLDTPRENYQKPSVDVLFRSMAEITGKNSLGILLTGMGRDGAQGLLQMKNSGAQTVSQDEASSVVYGMPRAAAEIGAAKEILSLDRIPARIIAYATAS